MSKKKKAGNTITSEASKASSPVQRKMDMRAEKFRRRKEAETTYRTVLLGIGMFLLMLIAMGNGQKGSTILLFLATPCLLLWQREQLRNRFTLPALILSVYCLMVTISTFYAPAGKFALSESLKVIAALCVFLLVLALEPESELLGRRTMTIVALGSALLSFLSIDHAGAKLFSVPVIKMLTPFASYLGSVGELNGNNRINTLLDNLNVYAGVAGIGILLCLGLLRMITEPKKRRLPLVCLAINSIGFLCAQSRGAMMVLVISFVVYLVLERGQTRSRAFVLMVETLVFSGIAGLIGIVTVYGNTRLRFLTIAITILCAAGLAAFDEFVGTKLADRLAQYPKATNIALVSLLGLTVVVAIAALNLTGPGTVGDGKHMYRAAYPAAGENTLTIDADGDVNVAISYQPGLESFAWNVVSIYSGSADGAAFTVPDDAAIVYFDFSADQPTEIRSAQYNGAESGSIKLNYLLLPESVAASLQGVFKSDSFMQRRVLWRDGIKIWKMSPIGGVGMGAFENKITGIEQFHFETKYAHNHYIQCLVDTGVVGLLLFVGTLLACAVSLILARKKDSANPLLPILSAALLFMAGQAFTDVIFSSVAYLLNAYAVLALIVICCGDVLPWPDKKNESLSVWLPRSGIAVVLIWTVLLTLNLYAHALANQSTYDALVEAAKIDRYEHNDYTLSYATSAAKYEDRDEAMTKQMYEYMDELEQVSSNIIPYYLAESYFTLGDIDKAFAMLQKYTAYTISDEENWDMAFRLAGQYNDGSEAYLTGLGALYQSLLDWNDVSLSGVALQDDVQQYLDAVLAR